MRNGEIKRMPVDFNRTDVEPVETTLMYGSYLSANLRERCEKFRRAGIALDEELALTRVIAAEAIGSFQRAVDVASKMEDNGKRIALMNAATSYVIEAINNVRDMAMAAHRVANRETLDPQMVQAIIFQAVKIFDVELQREAPRLLAAGVDPQAFVDRVTDAVDQKIDLDVKRLEKLGTSITPESLNDEVIAMNETVLGDVG